MRFLILKQKRESKKRMVCRARGDGVRVWVDEETPQTIERAPD